MTDHNVTLDDGWQQTDVIGIVHGHSGHYTVKVGMIDFDFTVEVRDPRVRELDYMIQSGANLVRISGQIRYATNNHPYTDHVTIHLKNVTYQRLGWMIDEQAARDE